MRFTKLMMLAALIGVLFAADSRGSFTVTLTGNATPIGSQSGGPNAGPFTGGGSSGPINVTFSTTSTQSGGVQTLTSNVTFTATTGTIDGYSVGITQDAYNITGNFVATSVTNISNTGPNASGSVSSAFNAAGAVSTPVSTGSVAAGGSFPGTRSASGFSTLASTDFVRQVVTVGTFTAGDVITFQVVTTVVATPVPATAVVLAGALPMLGLAGLVRRRVFGA